MSAKSRRRSTYNRGRWEIQRERARIEDFAPPAADQPARTLQEGLRAVLEALRPAGDTWLAELAADWTQLVGADVARHTRPAAVEGRCLVVYVDSSAWLHELQRFGQKRIVTNIQLRFGTQRVNTVRLRLDPDGRTENPKSKKPQ